MSAKKSRLLGLAFLFLGVLMITNVVSLPKMAIVIFYSSGPSLNYPSPSGSVSSPTPFASGNIYTIKAFLTDYNDPPASLTCSVQISYVSVSDGGAIPTVVQSLTLSSSTDANGNYAGHTYTWAAPSVSGTAVLRFHFTATNTAGLSNTLDTYASVGEPTGEFYINGQIVTASSVIKVTNPTLNFKISLTSLQSSVTEVQIMVMQGSTTVTTLRSNFFTVSGNDYSISYTLPTSGSYTITATIFTASNPSGLTLSVLGVDWNAGSSLIGNLTLLNTVLSLALLAAGSVLVVRKGKKSE